MEEVKLNSPNSGVMIYQSDTFHKTSQALHSCLRFSHLGVPKWALWIRSWNYIMSKASFGCCHPSTLCSSPTGSKEPEHLFFRPPATPSNRQWIDDEAHISDPHWLAPGGPGHPSRARLGRLIPGPEALRAFAHYLHDFSKFLNSSTLRHSPCHAQVPFLLPSATPIFPLRLGAKQ